MLRVWCKLPHDSIPRHYNAVQLVVRPFTIIFPVTVGTTAFHRRPFVAIVIPRCLDDLKTMVTNRDIRQSYAGTQDRNVQDL